MAIAGNLDYALARVAARQGQRVDDAAWRRLEASRDLDHYVAAVRSTALARWVSAMAADHDCHSMERSLRAQWRRYVEEVAGGHPQAWQVLQPRSDIRTQHCLLMLWRTMEQHAQALQRASDSAEAPRAELANRLQRLFRAAADTVIASVCHLALVALDLERLRGGLACRRLFGDDRAEHR